jgi:DNA-binding MarR family transcriptional regulator
MVGAEAAGMHAIFFGLKRAHHGTVRITRSVLAKMGLTAARFDMLYAIKERRGDMLQSGLGRTLGVCRATVSRMLASLEELGLVVRRPHSTDRRRKIVKLTTLGRWRIAFAHRHLTRSGWAQLAVDSALGGKGSSYHWYDRDECVVATSRLDGMLGQLRHAFFDRANLDYPWSPSLVDEVDPIDEALEELELADLENEGGGAPGPQGPTGPQGPAPT